MPLAIRTMGSVDNLVLEVWNRAHLDAVKKSVGVPRMMRLASVDAGHGVDILLVCDGSASGTYSRPYRRVARLRDMTSELLPRYSNLQTERACIVVHATCVAHHVPLITTTQASGTYPVINVYYSDSSAATTATGETIRTSTDTRRACHPTLSAFASTRIYSNGSATTEAAIAGRSHATFFF